MFCDKLIQMKMTNKSKCFYIHNFVSNIYSTDFSVCKREYGKLFYQNFHDSPYFLHKTYVDL